MLHKRLGELLLEQGAISSDQLEKALEIQKQEGGFIGKILVDKGFVLQSAVTSCLVKQCKIPHLSLLDYEFSAEVIALVPEALCLAHRLIPIDKLGRILTVAMVDPLDQDALEEIRAYCPELRIKPILCNWEHFDLVAAKVFKRTVSRQGSGEMTARSLGLRAASPAPARPVPVEVKAPVPAATQSVPPAAPAPIPPEAPLRVDHDEPWTQVAAALRESMVEAMQDALAPVLLQLRATSAQAAQQGSQPSQSAELVDALKEGIKEALRATEETRSNRESQIADIAEAVQRSVQQTSNFIEAASVSASGRLDRQPVPTRRRPVTPLRATKKSLDEGTERECAAADAQVWEALECDIRLESYAFANFHAGSSNAFVLNVCKAIAANPGAEYNPLFLYGRVGVGKTHLMAAIGNAIGARNEQARVGYISASHFARRMAQAAEDNALEDFRRPFCQWDVLLLDDIQFMGGKVEAQEEFFHIFNVLHQQQRQIIIASDKAPDRLGLLEQRLVSRFASGVVAELRAPEWETRMKILRGLNNDGISEEILGLIATRVTGDVRRMTGAFRKVCAFVRLGDSELNCETASEILSHFGGEDAA